MTPADFAAAAGVSRETLARLEIYADLLRRHQKAVNLVGPGTLDDLWRRHFLDSAQLFPLLPAARAGRPLVLLDLGSGAGFPGLVLALLAAGAGRPMAAHLVESSARKCAFLREVARQTGLREAARQTGLREAGQTGVTVAIHNARIEDLDPFPVDVLTARALAPLPRLLTLARPFLALPSARPLALFLKGRRGEGELTTLPKGWKMQADTVPSITEPGAVVLRLKDIAFG